jgi:prepilin-type N-terminal cleavage/methylation domain-containing protein
MSNRQIIQAGSGPTRAAGFTLIELMVTVTIVAILAAIAVPSYRNYVIRGQLTDATNGLSAMRANMERYYQDNRQYTNLAGTTWPCTTANLPSSTNFTFSCVNTVASPPSYQLKAVGTAGQLQGFTYYVDNTGLMSTTVATPPAPSGWASCSTGWVTKQGGC